MIQDLHNHINCLGSIQLLIQSALEIYEKKINAIVKRMTKIVSILWIIKSLRNILISYYN